MRLHPRDCRWDTHQASALLAKQIFLVFILWTMHYGYESDQQVLHFFITKSLLWILCIAASNRGTQTSIFRPVALFPCYTVRYYRFINCIFQLITALKIFWYHLSDRAPTMYCSRIGINSNSLLINSLPVSFGLQDLLNQCRIVTINSTYKSALKIMRFNESI